MLEKQKQSPPITMDQKRAIIHDHMRRVGKLGGGGKSAGSFTPESGRKAVQARWRNVRQQRAVERARFYTQETLRRGLGR